VEGQWFSPVSSTIKTDRHDITEILLKVALNTIKPLKNQILIPSSCWFLPSIKLTSII
jgi:hypothetical protein